MSKDGTISPELLERHLSRLTKDIGVRLAGSEGERLAAEYIAGEFADRGAAVSVEEYDVQSRVVEEQRLLIDIGGRWEEFPCSLHSSTPGTGGNVLEAPLVFFEDAGSTHRPDFSYLRGQAVVHLGTHIESRDYYRALMAAEPAFLLMVDIRYPGAVPLADGMFPAYTHSIGAVPTVNVAYMDAWRWRVEGATTARLSVKGGMQPGISQNVIADLPGTDPGAGLVIVGAHHDTQADSVGADDNAVGVAGLLELARVLSPLKLRRDIRLISFGAEEQLSVGSAVYVRRHRQEMTERGLLMVNLDSYGSHLGWTELVCNGPDELAEYACNFYEAEGQYVKIRREMVPYADHFPFVAAGVCGLYLGRSNCLGGRFFHHRPDDDMSRVSTHLVSELLDCTATLIRDAATAEVPFKPEIPQSEAQAVAGFWEDLFGGWG
ncbi:MAG: M28 family peptidase [bacterium]|nr:M28 family peptidase [bacterium]